MAEIPSNSKYRELAMKRHILSVTLVAAVSLFAAQAVYASPATLSSPLHAMFGKAKTVDLSIRNDSATTIELKVGEDDVVIEPRHTTTFTLPVGTRIVANKASGKFRAGALIKKVAPEDDGTTLAVA
jgi:hypothetical protein